MGTSLCWVSLGTQRLVILSKRVAEATLRHSIGLRIPFSRVPSLETKLQFLRQPSSRYSFTWERPYGADGFLDKVCRAELKDYLSLTGCCSQWHASSSYRAETTLGQVYNSCNFPHSSRFTLTRPSCDYRMSYLIDPFIRIERADGILRNELPTGSRLMGPASSGSTLHAIQEEKVGGECSRHRPQLF